MPRINKLTLLPKVPLLITESADEFDALRDAFEREIKPRGIIEQMYVHDICSIVWEILRLRRCKVVIINSAYYSALEDLLVQLRQPGQRDFEARDGARKLAHAWFTDKEAQKRVLETLGRFNLDESAIEAKAIRASSSVLELLDRMLTSLESRRDKALGCVAEYRASLAQQLRESADRILDGKVLRLEPEPNKRSTVA
jgi:predicted component of type VI protein secretion system